MWTVARGFLIFLPEIVIGGPVFKIWCSRFSVRDIAFQISPQTDARYYSAQGEEDCSRGEELCYWRGCSSSCAFHFPDNSVIPTAAKRSGGTCCFAWTIPATGSNQSANSWFTLAKP